MGKKNWHIALKNILYQIYLHLSISNKYEHILKCNWGDHKWTAEADHSSHLSIHMHLQVVSNVLATLFA